MKNKIYKPKTADLTLMPGLLHFGCDESKFFIHRNSDPVSNFLGLIRPALEQFDPDDLLTFHFNQQKWPLTEYVVDLSLKRGKGDIMLHVSYEEETVVGVRYITSTSTFFPRVREKYEYLVTLYGDLFALGAMGKLNVRQFLRCLILDIEFGSIRHDMSEVHICADIENMTTQDVLRTKKILSKQHAKYTSSIRTDPVTGISETEYDGQKGDPSLIRVYDKQRQIHDMKKERLYERYWGNRFVTRPELVLNKANCHKFGVTLEKCLDLNFLLSVLEKNMIGKYVKWEIYYFIEQELKKNGVESYELELVKPVHKPLNENEYYHSLLRKNVTGAKRLGRDFEVMLLQMIQDHNDATPLRVWK